MSDTPKTPETEVVEAETVTTEVTQETQKTQENTSEKGRGSRKPRRNDRRGIREEVKEFQEEILAIDRVTRVTAGGRQLRFRVSMVIGDGKGRVGLDGTIAHDVTANFKSSAIFIHPAHPGTGIIAGGSARKVFAVAGLKDVIAKQHGAPNTITNTRVTLKALQSLKPSSLTRSFSKAK